MDMHCHVFPAKVARRAAESVADFYQGIRREDMPLLPAAPQDVLEAQERAGIDLSILCSAATTAHQVRPINAFLARCVEESRGRLRSMGTLHPASDDIEGDIQHLLSLGLLGVKFHPEMQKIPLNSYPMLRLFDILNGRLPVLIHTGDRRFPYSNPEQLIPLLKEFPNTRFIGAHMGGFTMWEEATRLLAGRFQNLWVDLSSTACFVGDKALHHMINAYGTKRVLFGTDFPMLDPSQEVSRFLSLPLSEQERADIAWNNAAKLLEISI